MTISLTSSPNSANAPSPSKYPSSPEPARVETLLISPDSKSISNNAIPAPEFVKARSIVKGSILVNGTLATISVTPSASLI